MKSNKNRSFKSKSVSSEEIQQITRTNTQGSDTAYQIIEISINRLEPDRLPIIKSGLVFCNMSGLSSGVLTYTRTNQRPRLSSVFSRRIVLLLLCSIVSCYSDLATWNYFSRWIIESVYIQYPLYLKSFKFVVVFSFFVQIYVFY